MEDEKTLLQQIREMEQEFTKKIEIVRAETEAAVAAARSEAGRHALLCGQCRKLLRSNGYWNEKGKAKTE